MPNPPKSPERHILFVLENYYPNIGGVEKLFKTLVERLTANGCRVTIITTRLSEKDPAVETSGRLRILRYRFRNRYFFTALALFPILRHVFSCDLVHTTSYNAALPAFLAAKIAGKKIVVTFHELWASLWFQLPFMSGWGKWLHYLFEQMLIRLPFDRFVGVSLSTSDNLMAAGVATKRVCAIYNGLDYKELDSGREAVDDGRWTADNSHLGDGSKSKGIFTYTYFGRLGVSKGLDLLLAAAAIFRQQQPASRLRLIIPKTPPGFYKDLLQLIEKQGLNDYAQLLHELTFEQLKASLLASDCVVIPSYSEGFCFAAAEAAALGVPVISSGRMALKEVVSGRFINMKEVTPAALAEALELAANGHWQHRPLRKFELSDTVENYIMLYEAVLAGQPFYPKKAVV